MADPIKAPDRTPFARWVYRDVSFLTANADTPVPHEFKGVDPETIRWIVLQVEGAAIIYQGVGTRKAASADTIWLRASAVPSRARIALVLEHP
jgi:hypothetical protein